MSSLISKTIKYDPAKDKLITLACGCFWGTEHMYRKYLNDRIVDCKVGYANGEESKKDSPSSVSYKRVCGGDTDFAEVLQVSYNPKVITLRELTDFFFSNP
ncbi:Mxr1p [Saccharomyces cerevisiae FostersO]|nr:Mxr1p [Saccharomyces cerevisiae FostersO]